MPPSNFFKLYYETDRETFVCHNGKAKHPMAYVDLVVTPVVGSGWLVGEDTLDKYFIRRYEDRLSNRASVILFLSFLNPTRSFANVMRGKWPWHRDNRK